MAVFGQIPSSRSITTSEVDGLQAQLDGKMASNRGSDFVQATAVFHGTNATGTIASGAISVSVNAGGGGNQSIGMSNLGNTSGTTGVATGNPVRYLFAGGDNITLSQSLNGASGTLTISGANAIRSIVETDAGITLSGPVITLASGNPFIVFEQVNPNELSIGVITPSLGVSNIGNTAGNTGVVQYNNLVLAGGNNITLSQSTAAAGDYTNATITVSAGANSFGVSNLGNTGGDTGMVTGSPFRLVFSGAGIITAQQQTEAGGKSATVGFSAGYPRIGVSTQGNTSGATTVISAQSIVFVGTNNITLSQSTAAGPQITITISGPNPGAGAAPKRSYWPDVVDDVLIASAPLYTGSSGGTGGSTQWTVSGRIWSEAIPADIEFSQLRVMHGLSGTAAGTGSATHGHIIGIYTLNANTALSLVSSFVGTHAMSQNSITARSHRYGWGTDSGANSTSFGGNSSASFTGTRVESLYGTPATLSASNYYFVHLFTQRTSGANVQNVITVYYQGTAGSSTQAAFPGFSTTRPPLGWQGIFSTTSNGSAISNLVAPASIHTSVISQTAGTTQWLVPFYFMHKSAT